MMKLSSQIVFGCGVPYPGGVIHNNTESIPETLDLAFDCFGAARHVAKRLLVFLHDRLQAELASIPGRIAFGTVPFHTGGFNFNVACYDEGSINLPFGNPAVGISSRSMILVFLLLSCVAPVSLWGGSAATQPSKAVCEDGISLYFSPHGGCTDAIVREIDDAKKNIQVQAYSFTSAPIAQALNAAKKRGVEVTVVLDRSQATAKYSSATFLANSNIATFIDEKHAIAHSKVILVDDSTIITGSFNFSSAAENSNSENLLIIKGKAELFAAYKKNFAEHLNHSRQYKGLEEERKSHGDKSAPQE